MYDSRALQAMVGQALRTEQGQSFFSPNVVAERKNRTPCLLLVQPYFSQQNPPVLSPKKIIRVGRVASGLVRRSVDDHQATVRPKLHFGTNSVFLAIVWLCSLRITSSYYCSGRE